MTRICLLLVFCITWGLASSAHARDGSHICQALVQKIQQAPGQEDARARSEFLFEAASLDCVELALRLLEQGASAKARNRIGATALSIAAGKGSRDVASLLLKAGADLHHRDLNGATPLLRAARNGRRRMVRLLLKHGADPNSGDNNGVSPLMAAAFNGDLRMVGVFSKIVKDVDAQDKDGKVALIYAAGRAFPDIVEHLLEAGSAADGVWGNELTPLMWAAGHANDAPSSDGIKVVTLLSDAGVDINRRDNRGRTALMIAATRGHTEMIEFLLKSGADRALTDKKGLTALELSQSEAVSKLLSP
ncbi:MAG: ankyrin repeat domain-containing protein [Stappiaceae bacterium]